MTTFSYTVDMDPMERIRLTRENSVMFRQPPHETGERGEMLPVEHDGLPDSTHPQGLCPRCGKQSSFEIRGHLPITKDKTVRSMDPSREVDPLDRITSLICRNCDHGVAVIEEQWIGDQPVREGRSSGIVAFRGIHWWPLPNTNISTDIPTDIASVFVEAVMSLTANCPRASAVMARRTLEAIAVDKGETSGSLYNRLNSLATNGVLDATLAEWAKEVRLIGNVGAHFDPMRQVKKEDAQQLIDFIQQLMNYLYVYPAQLARFRSSSP